MASDAPDLDGVYTFDRHKLLGLDKRNPLVFKSFLSFLPLHSVVTNPDELVVRGAEAAAEKNADKGAKATRTRPPSPPRRRKSASNLPRRKPTFDEESSEEEPPEKPPDSDSSDGGRDDGNSAATHGGSTHLVYNILQQLDKENLAKVHEQFVAAGTNGTNKVEFVSVLLRGLNASPLSGIDTLVRPWEERPVVQQLSEIFDRIDIRCTGSIRSEEFLDYVLYGGESKDEIKSMELSQYNAVPIVIVPEHDEQIDRIDSFRDYNNLVTCHKNGLVSLWSSSSGKVVKRLSGHSAGVICAILVPATPEHQINRLITSSVDRSVIVWDAVNYNKIHQFQTGCPQLALAWCKANRLLYTGGTDGQIRVFDLAAPDFDMKLLPEPHTNWVTDIVYMESISSIVSCSFDRLIIVWNIGLQKRKTVCMGHSKPIHALCYCTTQRLLVSGGGDKDLLVWNPGTTNKALHSMKGHDKPVLRVFSVVGSHEIISGDVAGKVRIWDIRRFECIQSLGGRGTAGFTRPFQSLTYDQNHNSIVTVGRTWSVYKPLGEHTNNVTSKHPIAKILYNSHFDNFVILAGHEVTVWDAADGSMIGTFHNFSDSEITAMCLSDNQRQVLVANTHGIISVFNCTTGAMVQTFQTLVEDSAERTVFSASHLDVHGGPPAEKISTGKKSARRALQDITYLYHIGHDMLLLATASGYIVIYDVGSVGNERALYKLHSEKTVAEERNGTTVLLRRVREILCAAYCAELRMVAAGGTAHHFQVWKLDTFSSYKEAEVVHDITCCAFAFNTNAFVTGDVACNVTFYAIGNFHRLCIIPLGEGNALSNMWYSATASMLVTDHRTEVEGPIHPISWAVAAVARRYWQEMRYLAGEGDLTMPTPDHDVARTALGARAAPSETDAASFPRNPHKNSKAIFSDLNRFTMHAWDHHIDDLTCLGVTENVAGVALGSGSGRVRLYSPHGQFYGQLVVSNESQWTFPVHKKKQTGADARDAEEMMRSVSRMSAEPGSGDEEEDEDDSLNLPALQARSRASRKVDYITERERYMGALSPFYSEIQRSGQETEMVRPFFLPEQKNNVLAEAMMQKSAQANSAYWKLRKEFERHNYTDTHLLREVVLAKQQRHVGHQKEVYKPVFDGRAKRIDNEKSDRPWRANARKNENDPRFAQVAAELEALNRDPLPLLAQRRHDPRRSLSKVPPELAGSRPGSSLASPGHEMLSPFPRTPAGLTPSTVSPTMGRTGRGSPSPIPSRSPDWAARSKAGPSPARGSPTRGAP